MHVRNSQPEISMALTSGFLTSALGTVTVRTPFSMAAFTSSTFTFSGNLNRLMNGPLLRSTRCHLSFFSSFSTLLSPLICKILPSSTSTFNSSFFTPGRSALKTWASGVSFQSMRVFANDAVSPGTDRAPPMNGKSWNGSHRSNMLFRRPPKKLGIKDIFWKFVAGESDGTGILDLRSEISTPIAMVLVEESSDSDIYRCRWG